MHTAHLERPAVSQRDLDITLKTRSNPLGWNGQFSPQLVHSLLTAYGTPAGGLVMDPFAGSATVAGEALSLGHPFVGFEVNPAAYILGSLYTLAALDLRRRSEALADAERRLASLAEGLTVPSQVIAARDAASVEWGGSRSTNVVIAAVLLNAFRSSETATGQDLAKAKQRVSDLVMCLPTGGAPASLRLGDARATGLAAQSVDLVITSPPYINVFNYHQQYRPIVEAIGCTPLGVAGSEIGANRKHRQNRFLTVVQYCIDIAMALREMFRVCRREGRIIMIVGRESSVLGVPFKNGELVAQLAERGFGVALALRQERKFLNRFGQLIYEDVLHFEPADSAPSERVADAARAVALAAMHQGLAAVPTKSLELLRFACLNAAKVEASPLFSSSRVNLPMALRPRIPTLEQCNASANPTP